MITAKGLQQLGFTPQVDFRLRDDGDGPFIEEWISDQQQPTVADIEAAHAVWQDAWDAEQIAKQNRIDSVKSKLEALGLTTEEVQEAFGL